jgi:hypothetical protein
MSQFKLVEVGETDIWGMMINIWFETIEVGAELLNLIDSFVQTIVQHRNHMKGIIQKFVGFIRFCGLF